MSRRRKSAGGTRRTHSGSIKPIAGHSSFDWTCTPGSGIPATPPECSMSPSFRNAALLFALCSAACGCYAKPLLTRLTPIDQPVANYAIGETRKASPGSVMIERIEGLLLLPGYRQTQVLTVAGLDKQ